MNTFRENYTPEPLPYSNTAKDYFVAVLIGAMLAVALTAWWAA